MDNISGKANWFQDTKPEQKEEVKAEEIPPYVSIRDEELLSGFLYQITKDYAHTKKKHLGDAIVHLEIAHQILTENA